MRENWLLAVFTAAWIAMIPITIGYLVVARRIFARLEKHHSAEFDRLGRPSLFQNNTVTNGVRFMRFLLTKEYTGLDDFPLQRWAKLARWKLIFGLSLTAISLLLIFVAPFAQLE